MGPRPQTFLLGLLLLLGPETTQAHSFPGENTLGEQPSPELQSLKSFPFVCDLRTSGPNVPSESVHSLRPSDIKFVAAIGHVETLPDAGTAGAKPQPWVGKRPQQECMGVVTVLSDIIRHFNPSVLRPACTPGRRGIPHFGAEDLWIQAKELVKSMKKNQQLDFQNDWKLINVFFSDANQCHLCPSTQQHRHVAGSMGKLTRMLDYLLQEVPRAFVNLVDLSEAAGGSSRHQLSPIAEPCRCSEDTSKLSRVVAQWSYQDSWDRLLASSRYNEQESFSVVFQPFFYEDALSPHSGKRPHQDATKLALNLWNIMMEPAGQKDELLRANESWPMKCPSREKPYLSTYQNSNYRSWKPERHEKSEARDGMEIRCPAMDPSNKIPTSGIRLSQVICKLVGGLDSSE